MKKHLESNAQLTLKQQELFMGLEKSHYKAFCFN